ncbi:hypothetical protein RDI58_027843 [Solanum bulbocastanum]|uniref:Uncharacterized protein n=1 Tax=Solanum bulbocastanum TaxID=147425 RepID=A0AAN8SZ17_SOLBU
MAITKSDCRICFGISLFYLFIIVRLVVTRRGKSIDNILESARPPSISPTLPPCQQANGPTFVPVRKSNLKVNNGRTDMLESLNHSPAELGILAHPPSVSATSPLYQQANGTTFVPVRKSNLKVNNGGTDMPESLNHSPVDLGLLAHPPSISATYQEANSTTFVPVRKSNYNAESLKHICRINI